jgi:hypothetical protein
MKKIAIVVPVYKKTLTPSEQISLSQLRRKLYHFDRFVIKPFGLDLDFDVKDSLMLIWNHHRLPLGVDAYQRHYETFWKKIINEVNV